MKRNLPFFFNFGLRWNKSVYVLASSGRADKYSSCAPFALIYLHVYTDTIVISLTLICIHVAPVIPPSRLSENDISFRPRSHSSVKRPSLCWNYDSLSGMQRPCAPANRGALRAPASQGVPLCFASIPPTPPQQPPPTSLFAKVRAQSAELFPSNSLAGSGCRCYCFCVWFCLPALFPFFFTPPSPGSCQRWLPGRLVCVFLRSWKNVACEREVEALASATCELRFFSF